MKLCSCCGEIKPLDQYYSRKGKSVDLIYSSRCKPCDIRAAVERGTKKERGRRRWINKYKVAKGCSRCGYREHPAALDFHHHDNNKEAGVHALLTSKLSRLVSEMRKCVLLCANCHRVEHAEGG